MKQEVCLFDPTASSWIATIDSDIASMSDNEFAPIFAGGIVVMFGGLLSAVITGFILEKNDSYASVIADSYAQGADFDEGFWKSLSDEEKVKAEEILRKLKSQGMENLPELPKSVSATNQNSPVSTSASFSGSKKSRESTSGKEVADIFNDYDD